MLKNYPGKILLFGEYSLLFGTKGLVLPYEKVQGHWSFQNNSVKPDEDLQQFHDYSFEEFENVKFNWSLFKQDINKGLEFTSTIPKGSGLGSSGALIAAFYDRYALNQTDNHIHGIDLNSVRKDLAKLESFHHQKSSGIDPLVSWINRPILLNGLEDLSVLNQLDGHAQWLTDHHICVHLVPTHTKRKTGLWVEKFRAKLDDAKFHLWLKDQYCPLVNMCVDSFLKMDNSFFHHILALCSEQKEFLSEFMDLPILHQLLSDCNSHDYGLKLCGAGGGGHFLLFSKATNQQLIEKNRFLEKKYSLVKVL